MHIPTDTSHFRRVSRNTLYMLFGRLSTFLFGMITTMLLARYAGPELYGVYGYAISIFSILMVFVNLGMNVQVTRNVARDPGTWKPHLESALSLKTVLLALLLSGAMIITGATIENESHLSIYLFTGLAFGFTTLASTFSSVLYAFEKMNLEAFYSFLRSSLTAVTVLVLVVLGGTFSSILSGISLVALVTFLALGLLTWRTASGIHPSAPFGSGIARLGRLIRGGLSFSFVAIITVIYNHLSIILVKQLAPSPDAAGFYFAAFRIYDYSMFIPQILYVSLIPTFTKMYRESEATFRSSFGRLFSYGACFALLVAGLLAGSAEPIVRVLYGEGYSTTIPVLRWLAVAAVSMTGFLATPALIATGREKLLPWLILVPLALLAVIAPLLIPAHGVRGAGAAFAVTSLLSAVNIGTVTVIVVKAGFAWRKAVVNLLLAAGLFFLLYFTGHDLRLFFPALVLGIAAVVFLNLKLGIIDRVDITALRRLW